MDKKLTRKSLIAKARGDIRALSQPKGVRRGTWLCIQEMLSHLAGYLPEPYPSERHLAKKLGLSKTTLHRTVCRAESLGLLEKNVRSFEGDRWDGVTYLLTCLSDSTKAAVVRYRPEPKPDQGPGPVSDPKVVPSSSKKESSNPPSVGPHGSAGSGLAAETTREAGVPRVEPESEPDPIGVDPEAPLPVHRVKPLDPAKGLALHFDQRWMDMARRSRRYRGVPGSKRGMAIGYIKGVMLTQVDESSARAHMDAFVSAVASGEVEINDEQIPFERFTGWWGRHEVADPAEDARNRQVHEEMRRRRDERLAALDDGE